MYQNYSYLYTISIKQLEIMATKTRLKIRNKQEQYVFETLNEKLLDMGYTNVIWVRKSVAWNTTVAANIWLFKSTPYKIQLNMHNMDVRTPEEIEQTITDSLTWAKTQLDLKTSIIK